jgi:hypothetical protein
MVVPAALPQPMLARSGPIRRAANGATKSNATAPERIVWNSARAASAHQTRVKQFVCHRVFCASRWAEASPRQNGRVLRLDGGAQVLHEHVGATWT